VSGNNLRELSPEAGGGSMTELASYVLLPALKIMGTEYTDCYFHPICDNGVDIFTRGLLKYPHGTASFKVGLGVKSEGQLIISGTKGYAYVPAPWWKTDYFEIRYENTTDNRKYFYRFEGEGLRYELEHFVSMIEAHQTESYLLPPDESIALTKIIHNFREEIDKR
jgi:predicted dehydrogenase